MHEDWLVELDALQYANQLLVLHRLEVHHVLIHLEDFAEGVVAPALDLLRLLVIYRQADFLWLFLNLRTAVVDVATLDYGGTVQSRTQLLQRTRLSFIELLGQLKVALSLSLPFLLGLLLYQCQRLHP